jgi:hypothetical protein
MTMKRCLASLLLLGAVAYAADPPLTVSDVVTGPKSHVRITNRSAQPVTAWSLAVVTHPDADRTHREVYTADGYLSEATHGLPGASENIERLMPGQSRELPLDPLPADATVEVAAVVLADGTAFGDEQLISPIFAHRAKERDALRAVVDAFDEVLPAKKGAEALEALRARLSDVAKREESVPCRAALDAVQTYSQKRDGEDVDRALATYAAFVKKEYDLAERHSQRKR